MRKQLRNRYNNNKNKYLLFSHKYYENNKSMLSIKRKLYRSNNKLSIYMRNRQRRLKLNCNHITQKQINTLIANSNNTCHYCGIELNNLILNIDHFIPLSKGGPHTINNLVVSCKNCNLRKGNKLPEEWLKTLNKEK
jgi:5-methylcytosine-specific restriction endonuclease McrA